MALVNGDTDRCALLVIDVQHAFVEWDLAGKRRNNPGALERIVALLAAFRQSGAPVFHVRHSGLPESPFAPHKTGFAVLDEAREIDGEAVIVKHVNSAFIGTGLDAVLREADVARVVICGATTNHCVETSTRMAGNLGFDTLLALDATWTYDLTTPDGRIYRAEEISAMTEASLREEFATIVATADVVREVRDGHITPGDVVFTGKRCGGTVRA